MIQLLDILLDDAGKVSALIEPQLPASARLRRVGHKQHLSGIEKSTEIAVRVLMKPLRFVFSRVSFANSEPPKNLPAVHRTT